MKFSFAVLLFVVVFALADGALRVRKLKQAPEAGPTKRPGRPAWEDCGTVPSESQLKQREYLASLKGLTGEVEPPRNAAQDAKCDDGESAPTTASVDSTATQAIAIAEDTLAA